ncbi:hypothetical protein HanRHA438_Chr11g0504821 [Helianthus annuus]|nr:hypothetical protein HanIR_Chr11g0529881 [Helianthus annuus]KAJ0870825.1 hypothetical protein HanRHA438_Chr11g0504821 [Helianthus annuus]
MVVVLCHMLGMGPDPGLGPAQRHGKWEARVHGHERKVGCLKVVSHRCIISLESGWQRVLASDGISEQVAHDHIKQVNGGHSQGTVFFL